MTGTEDRELTEWQAEWRADGRENRPAPPDSPDSADPIQALRRRVRRRTIGLAWITAGELAFTGGILALLAVAARRTAAPFDLAAIASLGLLAVAAQVWALWNRRGLFRAQGESAVAFVEFSILRARRRLLSVRFGAALLAAETLVFLVWFGGKIPVRIGLAFGLLAVCVAVGAAALALLARYSRAELAALLRLKEEVSSEPRD